jgi:hypothetical protein
VARRHPDPLEANWAEMLHCLEADPDQTSQELLPAFKFRYSDRYHAGHLRTVQRRLKIWRHEAVQRLIVEIDGLTEDVSCDPDVIVRNCVRHIVRKLHEATRILQSALFGECNRIWDYVVRM